MIKDSPYKFLVFIGRFQPFHLGHLHIIQNAFSYSKKVIILCGSAQESRSFKNPWTFPERKIMIRNSLLDINMLNHTIISPLLDCKNNDELWVKNVQKEIISISGLKASDISKNIALTGYIKDKTSYYFELFADIKKIFIEKKFDINATDIRNIFFNPQKCRNFLKYDAKYILPSSTINFLKNFYLSNEYKKL